MHYIITALGCKVNQYEAQAVETLLHDHGLSAAHENDPVDLIIVNTCAVTAEGGRKSRQTIRKLQQKYPDAVTAVCGCWSQLSPDDAAQIGADVIHGSGDKHAFVSDIVEVLRQREQRRFVDDPFHRFTFEPLPSGAVDGRTRAMVKIQDGCTNFCTYCVIPFTRGRIRSLPLEDITAEAERLAREGFLELVLTGIEIASYGIDLPGRPNLADAVLAAHAGAPEMRLRLGSLEPTVITEEFCTRLSECNAVCDHFHLSLQSGCDRTLRRMNRKYDTAFFKTVCARLRAAFPGCALTADLITGFPGETEEDHKATLAFLDEIGFSQVHVFPYSRRPGTKADAMPAQLSHKIKNSRAHEAQTAADRSRTAYLNRQIGRVLSVLFETERDGNWIGHSGNYCLVAAHGEHLHGVVRNVQITAVDGETLVGNII